MRKITAIVMAALLTLGGPEAVLASADIAASTENESVYTETDSIPTDEELLSEADEFISKEDELTPEEDEFTSEDADLIAEEEKSTSEDELNPESTADTSSEEAYNAEEEINLSSEETALTDEEIALTDKEIALTDEELALTDEEIAFVDDELILKEDGSLISAEEAEAAAPLVGVSTVEDGVYYIVSALSADRVLDVAGGSGEARANIQLYRKNNTAAQKFRIQSTGNPDEFYVTNVGSGKALDAQGGGTTAKTNVWQYNLNYTDAQIWNITSEDGQMFSFSNKKSGLVLDVSGGKTDLRTNIWLYRNNGTAAQKWILVPAEAPALLTSGIYSISSALNGSMCLDVSNASAANGANVWLYPGNGSAAQQFAVTYAGVGYEYSIVNINSHRSLDAAGGATAPGTNVQQWRINGSNAQKWEIVPNEDNTFSVRGKASGLNLEIAGGSALVCANIRLNTRGTGTHQKWQFGRNDAAENQVPGQDSIIYTRAGASFVVDVAGGSAANCANAQIWQANGSFAQSFRANDLGDGSFRIVSAASGKVLDVSNGSRDAGANVWFYEWNGSNAQRWKLVPTELHDASFYFQNVGSGLYLTVNGAIARKANLMQDAFRGDGSQQFVFGGAVAAGMGWQKMASGYRYYTGENTYSTNPYHMTCLISGTKCTFTVYEWRYDRYQALFSTPGVVGRNGAGKTREGDGKTPLGTFTVGNAYGILDDPGSQIPYRKVTSNMYWCGNSESPYYNTLITTGGGHPNDEHLIDYAGVYNYLLDVGYNTARTPYKGSAIFLHCWRGADSTTAGCIAIPENMMRKTLETIIPGTRITISAA